VRANLDLGVSVFPKVSSFPRLEYNFGKSPILHIKRGCLEDLHASYFSTIILLEITIMVFPYYFNTGQMTQYAWETFNWCLRSAARPPWPLHENYDDLCPYFIWAGAEEVAHDFCLPELVQVTFYAMVVNDVLKLGLLCRGMAAVLKSALPGLRWFIFEGRLQ